MIDLHTHSTASDGTLAPGALVTKAHEEGLAALALTDHDTVNGLLEASLVATQLGFDFVPGVRELVMMRDERNARLVARLAHLRKPIELEEALALSGGQVLGRPHFARAMVLRGYVSTIEEAFVRYLGRGGAAHIPKQRLMRRDAVELIRAAGGVPVLAHPNQTQLDGEDLEAMVRQLKDFGLIGLETRYSGYTKRERRLGLSRLHKARHLFGSWVWDAPCARCHSTSAQGCGAGRAERAEVV
ncbi:MAG: PHP domain-containing protein [Myxococcota bacterium]|nr:PHP domain-containing protein [Myxococcota bacterium]